MKKIVQKIEFPLSFIVGTYVSYWLITNPFDTYVLPVIIIWIPEIIGWNAFFIFLGVLAGLFTLGLCSIISGEDNN